METEDNHDPERGGSANENEMRDILAEQETSGGQEVQFESTDPHEELERILGGQPNVGANKDSETDYNQVEARDEDSLTLVKNEIAQSMTVSNEEALEKLEDVSHYVLDHFEGQVQTLLMYDTHQRPFLTVSLV